MDGVTGAVQLYEAQVDDARLTITVVRTAMAYGTLAVARTPVRRLVTDTRPAVGRAQEAGARVTGAEIEDPVQGSVTVRARVVVLAAGTELSRLLPGATGPAVPGPAPPPVAVHLVLPRGRLRASTGLVLREGDRAVYVVPWGRHWIVGTTAVWSEPDRLLAALNGHLARPIEADAVESTFAGPAPLGPDGGRAPTVQVPVPGLVLVRGSGLAGYRSDAERAVDAAVRQIGGLHPASTTTRVPLLGADGFTARWNQRHLLARRAGVHVVVMEHLLHRYGSGVDALISAIQRRPELARPLPGAEDYLAVEVWFAVAHEGATQLRDVLARRTRIAMETWDGGAEAAGAVAELMSAELGWDDAERSRQISAYLRRAAADR
jgi:glycerol-3-phosphate dehydrogenase